MEKHPQDIYGTFDELRIVAATCRRAIVMQVNSVTKVICQSPTLSADKACLNSCPWDWKAPLLPAENCCFF